MKETTDADGLMAGAGRVIDELDERRALAKVSAGLLGRSIAAVQVGRFVLLERVGSGGMGVVYAAFDPQLDRRVAIKVLHEGRNAPADEALLDEARAIARLNHPSVVTIHEVGTFDGRPFLAMELVEGQPLDAWAESKPDWRDVVRVLTTAGEGLAAAHAAGIVHRDFKPSNVVLGEDGRVIVLDFGLASSRKRTNEPQTDESDTSRRWVGTPAYMAPEQHLGEPATAASDQFSFCAALYELAYGQLPFATKSRLQLIEDIDARKLAPLKQDRRVPSWLRAAILRGLSPDPAERWPSMRELVDALRARAGRSRWRLVGPLAVVGTLGIAAWAARPAPLPSCEEEATGELAGVWDADQADRVRRALPTVDASTGPVVADRIIDALDGFATAWTSARTETCEMARAPQTDPTLDARMECLDRQLATLDGATDLLLAPNAQILREADEIIPHATDVQACQVAEATVEVGSERRQARAELAPKLGRAELLARTGSLETARDLAEQAYDNAGEDLAWRARASITLGMIAARGSEHRSAIDHFQNAIVDAERAGDTVARLDALRGLAAELIETARHDEATRLLDQVEAAHGRFDPRPWAWDAQLLELRARIALERKDLDEAAARADEYMALVRQRAHDDPHRLLRAKLTVARVATTKGDREDALAKWEEVRTKAVEMFGDVHEFIAVAHSSTAVLMHQSGRVDEAEVQMRKSLQVREALAGPSHPSLIGGLINLGVLVVRRDPVEARTIVLRAVAIAREDGPTSRRELGRALHTLAGIYKSTGRWRDAAPALHEAWQIQREFRGDDHPKTITSQVDFAETLLRLERYDQALEVLDEAQAHEEAARGEDGLGLVPILLARVKALDYLERTDEALPIALRLADMVDVDTVSPAQKISVNNSLLVMLLAKGDAVSLARAERALADAETAAASPGVSQGLREAVSHRRAELRDLQPG